MRTPKLFTIIAVVSRLHKVEEFVFLRVRSLFLKTRLRDLAGRAFVLQNLFAAHCSRRLQIAFEMILTWLIAFPQTLPQFIWGAADLKVFLELIIKSVPDANNA